MFLFSDHDRTRSPHSQATASKTLEAFVKLTVAERRAVIALPGSVSVQCFPEGIEREDFVASKKAQVTEGEAPQGKKTRGRKTLDRGEASKMGRGKYLSLVLSILNEVKFSNLFCVVCRLA